MTDETRDGIPADVLVWLSDTYTERGIEIWFDAWRKATSDRREHMIRLARTADGGT